MLLLGCSAEDSPEARVRAMLAEAETAVESRALLQARDLISEHYSDTAGRNKSALLRLLGGYFLSNRSLHLLVQIDRIDTSTPGSARVRLFSAVAGQPFNDLDELFSLRAGLYRFDLELESEDEVWRLIDARWQRAAREDFLGI